MSLNNMEYVDRVIGMILGAATRPEQPVPDPLPARSDEFVLGQISDLSDDDLADLVREALDGIDTVQLGRYLVCDDFIAASNAMQKSLINLMRNRDI